MKRTLIGGTPGSLTLSGHTLHGQTTGQATGQASGQATGHPSDPQTGSSAARVGSSLWGGPTPPDTLPDRLREIDLTLAPERERVIDAEEIAAYLEADGLGDEVLRDRYGTGGLFDAAERLYRQRGTGRALHRPAAQSVPAFPWHTLLRGPLYLLPGLSGLLVAREMGSGSDAAFVFAAAFGWGWTMLIAGVRYAEPLAVPGRALRLATLLSGVIGLIGGGVVAALSAGPEGLSPGVIASGAGVGGSVALSTGAAGVLLALRLTGQFAGAFGLPLLAAGVVYAAPSRPGAVVAMLLLATVPLLITLNVTRAAGTLPARWATLRPHLRHAAYGWSLALTFVLLTGRLGAWTLLPVILSTGLLEAGVWHVQERLQHAARRSVSLRALRRIGLPTLPVAAAIYALVLGVWVYLAANLPIPAWAQAHPDAWTLVPTYGAATLLSAWLANHRQLPLLTGLWLLLAALLASPLIPPSSPHLAGTLLADTLLAFCAFLIALSLRSLLDPRSYR